MSRRMYAAKERALGGGRREELVLAALAQYQFLHGLVRRDKAWASGCSTAVKMYNETMSLSSGTHGSLIFLGPRLLRMSDVQTSSSVQKEKMQSCVMHK